MVSDVIVKEIVEEVAENVSAIEGSEPSSKDDKTEAVNIEAEKKGDEATVTLEISETE